ncbi:ATP-binding protein [Pleionea sediminis]|uniref:ATP-binding protein n=1 Tax=Pleionea sediminis TaxID=2569479 RepID=UPI001185E4B8|nr:ATP-binding protein [Pleionea sediminis]
MNIEDYKSLFQICQSSIVNIAEEKSFESSEAIIKAIQQLTHSDECILLINSIDDKRINLISQYGTYELEKWSLLETFDLMHLSLHLTFLERSDVDKISDIVHPKILEDFNSGVYISNQISHSQSLIIVLIRKNESKAFDKEDQTTLTAIDQFITIFLDTVSTSENAKKYQKESQRISRERSIWMESLAWINESRVDETQEHTNEDFYQKLIFQLSTLVSVQDAYLLRLEENNDFQRLSTQGDHKLYNSVKNKLTTLIETGEINKERLIKHSLHPENSDSSLHALIVPLQINGNCRFTAVLLSDKNYSLLQTMIVRLFCDGVENILERRELLGSIQQQNQRLIKEQEEQKALISELKYTQNQLLQSEKMASIGQLAAGVAHEINNPVGYISSNLSSLKSYITDIFRLVDLYSSEELLNDISENNLVKIEELKNAIDMDYLREDITELLQESFEGVNRVKKIVSDLKDFSRVGEHEWQLHDVHQGIDSTLNIVHNELKYKAKIVKNFGEIPEIECISSQLNQVLMNLFVNAGHAIENQGTITISTYLKGDDHICIEVADDGKGIPDKIINRIFDPFFTTKPVGKGTGLGLSLSYGIIERHHGKLYVNSKKEMGTTFFIELPIKKPVAETAH